MVVFTSRVWPPEPGEIMGMLFIIGGSIRIQQIAIQFSSSNYKSVSQTCTFKKHIFKKSTLSVLFLKPRGKVHTPKWKSCSYWYWCIKKLACVLLSDWHAWIALRKYMLFPFTSITLFISLFWMSSTVIFLNLKCWKGWARSG